MKPMVKFHIGKPFAWHISIQNDMKKDAFLTSF